MLVSKAVGFLARPPSVYSVELEGAHVHVDVEDSGQEHEVFHGLILPALCIVRVF